MHTVALQLAPILGAEKSKVPFFIAGGALVVWALFLSLALGMRKPEFPGGLQGQRIVSAITAVLVLVAASTAVITSGGPAKSAEASQGASGASTSTAAEAPSTPAPSTPATSTPAATTPSAAAPVGSSTTVGLSADAQGRLAYNTKQLSAKAGNVTIKLANASALEHNVTIAQGATVLGATPTFAGGTRVLTLKLKPGKYTFYCSVPGHRQGGMEGTLTVS
ncbi:MAG TPA: plastocyanin/azurin family copper-binding protein [Solirubrobacteraceae bacterium]